MVALPYFYVSQHGWDCSCMVCGRPLHGLSESASTSWPVLGGQVLSAKRQHLNRLIQTALATSKRRQYTPAWKRQVQMRHERRVCGCSGDAAACGRNYFCKCTGSPASQQHCANAPETSTTLKAVRRQHDGFLTATEQTLPVFSRRHTRRAELMLRAPPLHFTAHSR